MAAVVMDGKALAAKQKQQIRLQVEQLGRKPGLAVILVGDNPASRLYANGKKKDCEECGIYSEEYALPEQTEQEQLLELIHTLNQRQDIDGVLLHLPLPEHLNEKALLLAIDKDKDVDCFHPFNLGELVVDAQGFRPCTPLAVIRLMEEYGIELEGKCCVVVGCSNIVGKPLALMLLQKEATVIICHTKTVDLEEKCLQADILVSAAGKAGLITGDMVRPGTVVIDVAMNRDDQGALCGDVVYDEVAKKASHITPVPGGVGPMTRAMLMANTLYSAQRRSKST